MQKPSDILREVTNLISFRPAKDREAQEILCHVLDVSRTKLISGLNDPILEEKAEQALEIAEKVAKHYPLEYALGHADFMGMRFEVTSDVLIPRPDTESLVIEAQRMVGQAAMSVLDLCTGSGCIAVALKSKCPKAKVAASDISTKALEVARQNSKQHGTEIEFVQSDMLDGIDRKFDIIVCNPPYVPLFADYLEPEIFHEPPMALFGGEDGLYYYKYMALHLDSHLCQGGTALLEIDLPNDKTKDNVLGLFNKFSWDVLPDISGRPRVLKVRRRDEGI